MDSEKLNLKQQHYKYNPMSRFLSILRNQQEFGVLTVLVIIGIFFSITTEDFLKVSNGINLLRQASELGIVTVGVTFLMISGEFDLSVGSVSAFAGMTVALLIEQGIAVEQALPLSLIICIGFGWLNGTITNLFGIPSFITTLGTMMMIRGLVLVISEGWPRTIFESSVVTDILGGGNILRIPSPIIWYIAISIIGWFILRNTKFGFDVYATGDNEEAATLAGIRTKRVKTLNFMISSFTAGFSGIVSCMYLGSVAPTSGQGLELEAIAAAVVGGASLRGGVGSIIGAFLGSFIISEIRNGLVLLGTSAYLQTALLGLVVIAAVILNIFLSKKAS